MKNIFIIILPLLILMLYGRCSDDNNNDCIMLDNNIDALMDFENCPSDGLTMFCNGYACNFYEGQILVTPPVIQAGTFFGNCEVIDCFSIDCEFFGSGEDMNLIGILTIDEILDNSNFTG